jgi:hypothetical protein
MLSFFEWFSQRSSYALEPWLILGKGPSFSKRVGFDLGAYRTIGLNHVAREQSVLLAHAIDLDVVLTHGDAIAQNAQFLVMPWFPHVRVRPFRWSERVRFYPSDYDLGQWCEHVPALRALQRDQRLLWYNLGTSTRAPRPGCAVVHPYGFSSTAALNLLATAGVRDVRSLGVDGGRQYSGDFADLAAKNLLAAGQSSYDKQFEGIADTIWRGAVCFVPLDLPSALRISITAPAGHELAAEVLAYSIRRRASISVEIVGPESPAHLVFATDVLVQGDIRQLSSRLPGEPGDPLRVTSALWPAVTTLGAEEPPWRSAGSPFTEQWCRELLSAVEDGVISVESVAAQVRRGNVRASLLAQVERRLSDPLCLPVSLIQSDSGTTPAWGWRRFKAGLRRRWQTSQLGKVVHKVKRRRLLDPVDVADLFLKQRLRSRRRGFHGRGSRPGDAHDG